MLCSYHARKRHLLTDMDIFRSQFPYFNLVGNSIHLTCHWAISLVWQCQSKRKSRAASRGNKLTRSIELHDAEFSPCPLPLMNESARTKTRSLIKRRPTLVYWSKISAERTWPRTRSKALGITRTILPSPIKWSWTSYPSAKTDLIYTLMRTSLIGFFVLTVPWEVPLTIWRFLSS